MSGGSELRFSDGEVRFYKESIWYSGHLYSTDLLPANAIRCASHCDGYLTRVGLAVGESIKGSDGMTLTFEGREDTDTPAGRFEDCEVWVTRHPEGHVTIRQTRQTPPKKVSNDVGEYVDFKEVKDKN